MLCHAVLCCAQVFYFSDMKEGYKANSRLMGLRGKRVRQHTHTSDTCLHIALTHQRLGTATTELVNHWQSPQHRVTLPVAGQHKHWGRPEACLALMLTSIRGRPSASPPPPSAVGGLLC